MSICLATCSTILFFWWLSSNFHILFKFLLECLKSREIICLLFHQHNTGNLLVQVFLEHFPINKYHIPFSFFQTDFSHWNRPTHYFLLSCLALDASNKLYWILRIKRWSFQYKIIRFKIYGKIVWLNISFANERKTEKSTIKI